MKKKISMRFSLLLLLYAVFSFIFCKPQVLKELNFMCDGVNTYNNSAISPRDLYSCTNKKLRILVLDYGFVDSMTGAANRHLGLLYCLGALGHDIKRAALRVGPTKDLPELAKPVFDNMHISQHPKRMLNFRTSSIDEYLHLVRSWDPDLVVMTLWFCGPSINATTPGFLLAKHKELGLRAKVVIESSDVHSMREDYLRKFSLGGVTEKELAAMREEESRIYLASDGVLAISEQDKQNIETLMSRSTTITKSNVFVWRYVGAPWDLAARRPELTAESVFSKRSGLIFVGPGNVPTNVAALEWFLTEILPGLSSIIPELVFNIVGQWRRARRSVKGSLAAVVSDVLSCREAAGRTKPEKQPTLPLDTPCRDYYERINFLGKLPQHDLEIALRAARVFVSPIRFSTGVNTKNLLALERALPLVTSTTGSAGLCPQVGFDNLHA